MPTPVGKVNSDHEQAPTPVDNLPGTAKTQKTQSAAGKNRENKDQDEFISQSGKHLDPPPNDAVLHNFNDGSQQQELINSI